MLHLDIEEVDNGYIIHAQPSTQGFVCKAQYVATDVHALGLLVKQLAGAEKDKQCKAKRKS